MKLGTILVGVDFSPASIPAINHALALVGKGTVRLLHVNDTRLAPHHAYIGRDLIERLYDDLAREAQETLAQLVRDLDPGEARLVSEVRQGRPADEIVTAAEGADLVVVGAHARDALGRIALGSVAEEVARRSEVPTLIVREGGEGSTRVERVLLALDVTEPSDEPIAAASDLASALGAKLEAIHVIPWPIRLGPAEDARSAMELDIESRVRDAAPRAVHEAITRAIGKSAAIHVVTGKPADEILRHARPSDVLVCGTHGRGAIGRFVWGSVATKLARGAPCPILVVGVAKTSGKKARGKRALAL